MKNEILSVPWTAEPLLDDLPPGLSSDELSFLHSLALSGDKRAAPLIRKCLARFPDYATLLNYLRSAYQVRNQHRQADEVMRQLATRHPDYLFTRIALAMEALDSKQPEKAAAALGPTLDIRRLYPERESFHFSEMRNYYTLVGIIHARRGDPGLTQGVKAALDEIDPNAEVRATLTREIMLANLKNITAKTEADNKRRISVEIAPFPAKIVTTAKPMFHHEEIHGLYEDEPDPPLETIRQLLALPRATLVEDLTRVLEDCIVRTPNFMKGQVDGPSGPAATHALNLLAELDATEALESLLRLLSLHPDALDFWIGPDGYAPQISRIIAGDIPRCTEWLKSPAIARRAKGILAEAMEHHARIHPQRRDEIVHSMEEALAFLLDAPPSANLLDTGSISLLVCCIIELRAKRLLPLIETAYRKNLIEEGMVGNLDSVSTDISEPPGRTPAPFSIEAYYQPAQSNSEPSAPLAQLPGFHPSEWSHQATPELVVLEAGRNDPCPCGSGRKHKKCCLR